MVSSSDDGPSISTYLETRFNLLTEALKESANTQTSALGSSIEATKAAMTAVRNALEAAMAAADLRYQQRFDAQADALVAAFSAAKEAVSAALAAQDRAVLKAELAADKRFEALNELRQMLNDTLKILMTRTEVNQMVGAVIEKVEATGHRIDTMEARLNLKEGESSGNRRTKEDAREVRGDVRAYIAVGVSLILLALAIVTFFLKP